MFFSTLLRSLNQAAKFQFLEHVLYSRLTEVLFIRHYNYSSTPGLVTCHVTGAFVGGSVLHLPGFASKNVSKNETFFKHIRQ